MAARAPIVPTNSGNHEKEGPVESSPSLVTAPPLPPDDVLRTVNPHGLTDQTNYLSTRRVVVVYLALASVFALTFLDLTIVATALPRISDDLHAGSESAWVASSYLLTK